MTSLLSRHFRYAYWTSVHVVACWLYGGIRFPFAIGAVVEPLAGRQTPLSGQLSPVRAVVPRGFFMDSLQWHGNSAVP